MSQPTGPGHRVTVIIKALNEERNIRVAVESALSAVAPLGGDVILADSCSTDRTVDIARQYPITIVQLAQPHERCCGIGPQLGYQYARGDYVYILDGDMRLYPAFLQRAVAHLDAHPRLAGLGGLVIEHNTQSLEYIARAERAATGHMQPGAVERLDMGGLYRRSAVEAVGYFSDRNLHSYEETDLALRLRSAGWQLERINEPAVDHHGHDTPPYELLRRRWRSNYILGIGEIVRAAIGRPHAPALFREVRELRLYVAAWLWLGAVLSLLGAGALGAPALAWAGGGLLLALPLAMVLRKRSVAKGAYATVSLLCHAAALLMGLLRPRTPAAQPVAARVIQTAGAQPR